MIRRIRILLLLSAAFLFGAPMRAQDTSLPIAVESPLRVGVAVFVRELHKVNDQAGTFEATFDLQLRWRDPRVAFSAKELGTDRQDFTHEEAVNQLGRMWTPQVTITNLNGAPKSNDQVVFIYAQGNVMHVQRIRAVLDAKFKMKAFPFDTQRLPIRIACNRYTIQQVALVQDQRDINTSKLRPGIAAGSFTASRIDFLPGRARGLTGDYQPWMEAGLTVQRNPYADLVAIFTPLLAVMLIPTIITLYAKADVAPRLTAWAGSILALLALNFTFSIRYAAAGSDSLVTSVISAGFAYQLFMVLVTVTVVYPVVADRMSAAIGNKFLVPEVDKLLKWAAPVLFLGSMLSIVLLASYS